MEEALSNPARVSDKTFQTFSSINLPDFSDTLSLAQLFGKLMVHVVNGDQLQSLLTVIKYLTKDIEDKEETFEVLRSKMLKLLSKPWLENDSAALDESIKSLLQFTDDELSELSYGVLNYLLNFKQRSFVQFRKSPSERFALLKLVF